MNTMQRAIRKHWPKELSSQRRELIRDGAATLELVLLLPLIVLRAPLNLGWKEVALVTTVFAVLNLLSLRVRHPRRRPVEADGGA